MLSIRRAAMVAVLWALLTGSSVFFCGSDTDVLPGLNRPPDARDDEYQVPAGTTLSATARASDPDGDELVLTVVSGPTLGRLESFDAATGAFLYLSGVAGADSFTFRASDGRLESNTGRVNIQVNPVAATAVALAATAAGPVVLAEGGLALLDAAGPIALADGVGSLSSQGQVTRTDGRAGCIDAWTAALLPADACAGGAELPHAPAGHVLAVAADPWASGSGVAVVAAGGGVEVLVTRSGGRDWSPAARREGSVRAAELHYALSRPGKVWLALTAGAQTRILAGGDDGRGWRAVGSISGAVTALAGLPDRDGVYALRAPPDGPALVIPAPRGEEP
jgi:hypothetical protein